MSRAPPLNRRNIQILTPHESAYLNRALLALDGARQIQQNDQATPIIYPNTGLTQATQDYLLQHHSQLILETTQLRRNPRTNRITTVNTPIITEALGILYKTATGSYTVYYAYDQINNKRLGLPNDLFN